MKNMFLGALVALSFSCFSQTITPRADFPGSGRFGAVRFVINDMVYVGLGEAGEGVYPKDFYKFDPVSNQWTPIADFPGAGRETGIAYTVNGKGYVGLGISFVGGSTNVFSDLWRYDPVGDTWTQLGNFDGGARSKAAAFVLNGSAYIGTGINAQFGFLNDWWKYDPVADNWIVQNNLDNITYRYGSVAFVANNKAYLAGGRGNAGVFFSEVHEFDPNHASNGWVLKATDAVNLQFVSAAAFVINNNAYLCYGLNANFVTRFDLVTNEINNLGDLLGLGDPVRYAPVAYFTTTGKGYLGLGYTSVVANQASAYKRDFWQFNFATTPVKEPLAEAPAKILPTDQKGIFSILFISNSAPASSINVQVFDALGRMIYTQNHINSDQQIDLNQCAPGTYFVRISSQMGFWTQPVFI